MKKFMLAAVLAVATPALAQDSGGGQKADKGEGNVKYSKTTTINFEDDVVEGDLTKPDGEYVEARNKVKHSNLIKIREEFKDKVMSSVGEL